MPIKNAKSPTKKTTIRANTAPLSIQREINKDYAGLAKDYVKLGESLWRYPITKIIVAGIGIAVLVPLFKTIKKVPAVEHLIDTSMDTVKDKWNSIAHQENPLDNVVS